MQPAKSQVPPDVSTLVKQFCSLLGEQLVAVYQVNQPEHDWAKAHPSLLLVLASLHPSVLDQISALRTEAEERGMRIQVDTQQSLLRGADAFPARTVSLCTHRLLVWGTDVLAGLRIERHHLRLHVEHGLRSLQHRLVDSYMRRHTQGVDVPGLRREVRRLLLLLEGAVIVAGGERGTDHDMTKTVEQAAATELVPATEVPRWHSLVAFAQGARLERAAGRATLFTDLFELLGLLIDKIDALESR